MIKRIQVLIIIVFALLIGCKQEVPIIENPEEQVPQIIISNEKINSQINEITPSSIILSGSEIPTEVKVGGYLVSDITEKAPFGYLRKVTSIETKNSKVVIHTINAYLTDIVKNGSVAYNKEITVNDIIEKQEYDEMGQLLLKTRASDDPEGIFFTINRDVILYDGDKNHTTKDDQITVNGDMNFSLSLDFAIDIKDHSLKYVKASAIAKNNNTVSLSVSAKMAKLGNIPLKNEILLARWKLKPFTIIIAGIPVPIASNWIAVYMNAEGVIKAEMKSEIKNENRAELGIEYKEGKWEPIAKSKNTFEYAPFDFKGEASVKSGFAIQWEARPYGLGDSRISLGPYLYGKVKATLTQNDIEAVAKLGCEVKAEAALQIFTKGIAGVNFSFPLFNEIILWEDTWPIHINRPKLAIEYFAEYNVNTAGNNFTNNHENDKSGYFNWYVATGTKHSTYNISTRNIFSAPAFAEYHLPSKNEWAGVMPPSKGSIYNSDNVSEEITIKGVTNTYTADYRVAGNGLAYGIRMKGNGDEMKSAYRYDKNNGKLIVTVRYLGPNSRLAVDEISNETWWNSNKNRDISRIFPACGSYSDSDGNGNPLGPNGDEGSGMYWTSTPYTSSGAWIMNFGFYFGNLDYRYGASSTMTLRPVSNE